MCADRVFTSDILPRFARRMRSLDTIYLRGLSRSDFLEALSALMGQAAPVLSAQVLSRLKGEWAGNYARWQQRDLSAPRYVYLWADEVYL